MLNADNTASNMEAQALPLVNFFSLSRAELADFLQERFSLSPYRADQLFQWVYQRGTYDTREMTNIKKAVREDLASAFSFSDLNYFDRQISNDGTRKYLFEVESGHKVESVMIKQEKRMTLCVSSQVGCALACQFCRTGTMGLTRHLDTSEIVKQFLGVIEDAKNFDDMFTNTVFMGMGEPLHNIDNVLRAIRIVNDDFGLGLSARKITVSTVGLVPAIEKFFDSGVEANLAVSLNATTDDVRDKIMPVNKKYPLFFLRNHRKQAAINNVAMGMRIQKCAGQGQH